MEKKSQRQYIADKFRNMKVGEVIQFPLSEYNPSTIRSMPAASLLKEVSEGCKWRTRANIPEKCIDVIRVS
ncbi:MAG: hypothetical protein JFR41_10885 [Muribaculaceae bacterium]|nr:hypothetical protein [Muribaculaceae bacterium]